MRNLVLNRKADWNVLFELFRKPIFSINDFLVGDDFFYIVRECYDRKYANSIFSDFLWTMRSIYLPLCFVMKTDVPKAWQQAMPECLEVWLSISMAVDF